MQHQLMGLLQTIVQKGLPVALSFADDALLLLATRVGLHWPWLHWLSTVLLAATLLYWGMQLLRFLWIKWIKSMHREPDSKSKA
ncbi:hypothetical protein VB780_12420 [Leptolyngbya sp. CCNP1308]|uniref:hypothetical protein n=1 Tax=Leptolyngbya sp. CCNP1308 TaxID=3110255 RepID=UPI002B20DF60|nr:hypothetical protein [Leptolyngbya sp. CCNP1308]MEA5449379.1 hypothetical protein [Leptolyngbya sp. CCNP1308]